MKLIWSQTGDELLLNACNKEFADYWTQSFDGSLTLQHTKLNVNCLDDLLNNIVLVNSLLKSKFKISKFDEFVTANLFDQAVLNCLHRTWVSTVQRLPSLPTVLASIDTQYFDAWNQINKLLHAIELDFQFEYWGTQYWETPNPFGTDVLNFDHSHISIIFSQKGRTTYDKWKNFDNDFHSQDTNNYAQIGSEIKISLFRPTTRSAPVEYLDFCKHNNIVPAGDQLNLANFSNYEQQLPTIRELFYRNLQQQNNTITIQ
jgi:hypothetical protein